MLSNANGNLLLPCYQESWQYLRNFKSWFLHFRKLKIAQNAPEETCSWFSRDCSHMGPYIKKCKWTSSLSPCSSLSLSPHCGLHSYSFPHGKYNNSIFHSLPPAAAPSVVCLQIKWAACQFFIFLGSKVASLLPGAQQWWWRWWGNTFARCVCKNTAKMREHNRMKAKRRE